MNRTVPAAAVLALAIACAKADSPPPASSSTAAAAVATTPATCPHNGLWAECSALYALERAGLAPHADSSDAPSDKLLTGRRHVLKLGTNAMLELYFYSDSSARKADETALDRTQFVSDSTPQTIKRERTLIESANLVGLLTSINSHQRQRVGDALSAGPPQANTP